MTDPDLDAIEARANAAKRGPWVVETPESVYGHDGGPDWIDLRWVSDEDTVGDDDPPWLGPMLVTDAEFIAHARTDVPALIAALREARAKVGLWEADFPCDEGCRDYPEETCSRHGRRPDDLWERVEFFARERDDWRRRYEALRDGVTGLCDEAERRADPGVRLWSMPEARVKTSELRAVVARVEGDES